MNHTTRGFTLIEVLVALAIFALVAAAAYASIAQLATVQSVLDEKHKRLREVQLAVGTLERDLRDAMNRSVRNSDGVVEPALIGRGDTLRLGRSGRANPMAQARANVERVDWRWQKEGIERRAWPFIDGARFDQAEEVVLLTRVSRVQFTFLGNDGRWLDQWPAPNSTTAERLPKAVRFSIETADYGTIERTIACNEFSGTGIRDEATP